MNFLAVLVLSMLISVESLTATEDETIFKKNEINGENQHNFSISNSSLEQRPTQQLGRRCYSALAYKIVLAFHLFKVTIKCRAAFILEKLVDS